MGSAHNLKEIRVKEKQKVLLNANAGVQKVENVTLDPDQQQKKVKEVMRNRT